MKITKKPMFKLKMTETPMKTPSNQSKYHIFQPFSSPFLKGTALTGLVRHVVHVSLRQARKGHAALAQGSAGALDGEQFTSR
jgi:hypothetical protein